MRDWQWLAAAVLLAVLSVTTAIFGKIDSPADIPDLYTEQISYIRIGIEAGAPGGILDNERPPLYPWVLSIGMALFGREGMPFYAFALQGALAVGIVLLCYFEGRRLTDSPRWGLLAAALAAANLSMMLEFLAPRETVFFALILLLILGELQIKPADSAAWRALIPGALCGLAWLTRPTGIVVVAATGVVFVYTIRSLDARACYVRFGCWAVGLVAPIALWTGYQAAHGMKPEVSGRAANRTFYYSWHPAMASVYPIIDVDRLDPYVNATVDRWKAEGRDPGKEFQAEGWRFLSENPGRSARIALWKAAAFLVPMQFPYAEGRVRYSSVVGWKIEDFRPLPIPYRFLGISAIVGIACFLVSLIKIRHMPEAVVYTALLTTLMLVVHVVMFAETRYRQPVDPVLAVAAVGVLKRLLAG